MAEDEENKIIAAISNHNSGMSKLLYQIMGGVAVGVVMGSVIFWRMDSDIKEIRTNQEQDRMHFQKKISSNSKNVAVIDNRVGRLERVIYKDK